MGENDRERSRTSVKILGIILELWNEARETQRSPSSHIPAPSLATPSVDEVSGSVTGTRLDPSPHPGQHHSVSRGQTRSQDHRAPYGCREPKALPASRVSPEFSPVPNFSGSASREILLCLSYRNLAKNPRSRERQAQSYFCRWLKEAVPTCSGGVAGARGRSLGQSVFRKSRLTLNSLSVLCA